MSKESSVQNSWLRVEKWLAANMRPGQFSVAPAATLAQMRQAESEIGIELPVDVHQFYLLHNGSNGNWVCPYGYLMPVNFTTTQLSSVVRQWNNMKEMLDGGDFDDEDFRSKPIGPIRTDWWNLRWIPIVYNRSGDYLCIDMAPAQGGDIGQIICVSHEKGATHLVASSFEEWLLSLAEEFGAGKYRINAAGDLEYVTAVD